MAVLLFLSRFGFRGTVWMRRASYVFALVMFSNGLLHIAASLTLGRPAPGVYSSPLLLAASAYLLVSAQRYGRQKQA